MNSSIDSQRVITRRLVIFLLTLVLSLALPIVVIYASFQIAFSDKPLARGSSLVKAYYGSAKGDELWFSPLRIFGRGPTRSSERRMTRLNLETGEETETDFAVKNDWCTPFFMNGEVFGHGTKHIYKQVGSTLEPIGNGYWRTGTFYSPAFAYDDRITMIREIGGSVFQLHHLVDGEWVEGRKILLPPLGSAWVATEAGGMKLQLPPPAGGPGATGNPLSVFVACDGSEVHVLLTDYNGFSAYRCGFQFADDDQDVASALAPENRGDLRHDHNVSGWEPIQPFHNGDECWLSIACDRHGVLFASSNNQRVVKRQTDGQWAEVTGGAARRPHWGRTVNADRNSEHSYLVDFDQDFGSFAVQRIDGNVIQPPHIARSGCEREYLGRWFGMLVGLVAAWVIHQAVMVVGNMLSWRAATNAEIEFGHQRAKLASPLRRSIAFAIDVVGGSAIVALLLSVCLWNFGAGPVSVEQNALCNSLIWYERAINGGLNYGYTVFKGQIWRAFVVTSESLKLDEQVIQSLSMIGVIALCILLVGKVYLESRFGFSPGKWLVGIRAIQSTLRPSGIARALTRNLLYWVDMPLLITAIPASISMMFSTQNQRLGDRVADTLVINSKPVTEADSIS